jgi:hypothetical protein
MAAYPVGDPAEPAVTVRFVGDERRTAPPMSAAALARLELPWLADGVSVRVTDGRGSMVIRRERHRLISDGGGTVGRFDGVRLLRGEGGGGAVPGEPGLVEVTFASLPTGPRQSSNRPMDLPEILDLLRRLPTRTGSCLSAEHQAGCVQMRWADGRLWLETPHPADATVTGRYARLDEAERILTILATEHRNAVPYLDGVTTKPW